MFRSHRCFVWIFSPLECVEPVSLFGKRHGIDKLQRSPAGSPFERQLDLLVHIRVPLIKVLAEQHHEEVDLFQDRIGNRIGPAIAGFDAELIIPHFDTMVVERVNKSPGVFCVLPTVRQEHLRANRGSRGDDGRVRGH